MGLVTLTAIVLHCPGGAVRRIVMQDDVRAAVAFVESQIKRLLAGRCELWEFVMTGVSYGACHVLCLVGKHRCLSVGYSRMLARVNTHFCHCPAFRASGESPGSRSRLRLPLEKVAAVLLLRQHTAQMRSDVHSSAHYVHGDVRRSDFGRCEGPACSARRAAAAKRPWPELRVG